MDRPRGSALRHLLLSLWVALFSAVDPVAVIALFGNTRFRADPVLVSLLNGECVLYDAVAIVLFTSLEKHIDEASPALLTMDVLGLFVLVFFGSFLFGVIAGALVAWCYHQAEYLSLFEDYEFSAMCLSAYLTFALAQFYGLSGIVSLFFFEIMLEHYYVYNLSVDSKVASKEAFKTLAHLSVTSSSAVTMWSALCPCGASVRPSGWCSPPSRSVADVLVCISCRFHRYKSCF